MPIVNLRPVVNDQKRGRLEDTKALGPRSDKIEPTLSDFFGEGMKK